MAYRNKTYICFDGDEDMKYYRLMQAWSENEHFSFDFYNAHDLNSARYSSQEESIKRQLRERLNNSKIFIVLIGNKTAKLTKFVKWEMEIALRMDLPIVAVNINGSRHRDNLCPSTIRDELAIYVSFQAAIIEYAMEKWQSQHLHLRKQKLTGPYFYHEDIYKKMGI